MANNFSILINVYNEQKDLRGCIESVGFSDDIVVYDSYSTDNTLDIARSAGARVIQRPGQNISVPFGGDESLHRQWGIQNIKYKYPWLFVIDADERLSIEAIEEIQSKVYCEQNEYVAYRIRRKDYLLGRHLKHVQASSWYIRLFRPEYVRYKRIINPTINVEGEVGQLKYPLEHYPFSKGFSHWFERHNGYSSFEAKEIVINNSREDSIDIVACLFEKDPNRKRYNQKKLFYKLPARPLLKFILLYFLKRGFLDGSPGFIYALLQSVYEYMIVLKVVELKRGKI